MAHYLAAYSKVRERWCVALEARKKTNKTKFSHLGVAVHEETQIGDTIWREIEFGRTYSERAALKFK